MRRSGRFDETTANEGEVSEGLGDFEGGRRIRGPLVKWSLPTFVDTPSRTTSLKHSLSCFEWRIFTTNLPESLCSYFRSKYSFPTPHSQFVIQLRGFLALAASGEAHGAESEEREAGGLGNRGYRSF